MQTHDKPPNPCPMALLAAFVIPLLVVCALCWPMPLQPGSVWNPSLFGASHAWLGDHLWRAISSGEPLHQTLRAGYPWERSGHFIGWLPLLAILPLQPVVGAIAAFHTAELLALPLSSLAAWPLLRRWSGAGPWSVAAGCVAFALCPFALGTLSSGELPKLCTGLLPLFLYALDRALGDERSWAWAGAAAALATITGFTSPYFGLIIPLLTLGMVAADAWRRRRLLWPAVCGAAAAAGLAPVALYFRGLHQAMVASLYMPAQTGGRQPTLPIPHPAASLQDLLLGLPLDPATAWDMRHVAYLGSLLVVVLAMLAWRQRGEGRGRGAALTLLIAGALMSLGPWLYPDQELWEVPLPALILAKLRYPLATGGMYYRLAVMGSLGLALWLVVECARRPRLAWLLLSIQLGDSLRASGPWPLGAVPVPGAQALAELQGDDGAVLDLPFDGGLVPSQQALLLAAIHGRPTTALPRILLPAERAVLRPLWGQALSAEDAPAALRALGIRYVVSQDDDPIVESTVSQHLGAPKLSSGQLVVWDLGPTILVPRPLDELTLQARKRPIEKHRPKAPRGMPPAPSPSKHRR